MRERKWVAAYQLNLWAETTNAKTLFPELIRRLAHATVEQVDLESVDFPSGEEIHRPGYDGVTVSKRGNAWVPVGMTYWELGTDKYVEGKLNKDYNKRIKDRGQGDFRETTFISITPHDFTKKRKWVEAKNKLGHWREVRIYDSDNLEQWLENAPGVALWLRAHMSILPDGLADLSSHWDNIQDSLRKKLPPAALLVTRQNMIESFKEWLNRQPQALIVQGHSPQEVVDVFTAWVESLPKIEQDIIASRTIIIENAKEGRALIDSEQRLILICGERSGLDQTFVGEARRKGHHILIPVSSIWSQGNEIVRLDRMNRVELEKILAEAGLTEQEAYSLAHQSGGSFTVLKRRFSSVPIIESPKWGEGTEAIEIAPLLLAGSWKESISADQVIISKIAGRPYNEVWGIVNRLRYEDDAPVRWINGIWEFISPLDAWTFLSTSISPAQLDLFGDAAKDVLGVNDPRLELSPEERWQASFLGKRFDHSNELRNGIAQTLALLATQDVSAQIADTMPLQIRVNRIVAEILPENADWRRWASLGGLLPLIAEAAPEIFLTAVEYGLRGDQPELAKLFIDEYGAIGQSEHTGLLWALERLAWSPDFLPRVSVSLARLAECDPGGKIANRPQSSLRDIFFSWMPHTAAPLEQRIDILKLLLSRHHLIGWKLLLSLLPHGAESILDNPTPEWRFWAEGWNRGVSVKEYLLFVQAMIQLATSTAIKVPERWIDLIDYLIFIPREDTESVLEGLESTTKADLAVDLQKRLWDGLREEIRKIQYHSDTKWALPQHIIIRLETIRDSLQPQDAIDLAIPLFKKGFDHVFDKSLSWEQNEKIRWQNREDAIRAIIKSHGFDSIINLVQNVQKDWDVGVAFVKATGPEYLAYVLPALLCHPEESVANFAGAYATNLIGISGRDWAESLPLVGWKTAEVVKFIIRMPFDNRTWDYIKRFGSTIEDDYWRQTNYLTLRLSPGEIERACRKLITVGRPISAIELLAMEAPTIDSFAPNVILDILEIALAAPLKEKENLIDRYHILELLERLQKATDVDETKLARLEWLLLPLIECYHYFPATLHKRISGDPDFFIELLTAIYKPHHRDIDEEKNQTDNENDEINRLQSERAWKLLNEWRQIPGMKGDGKLGRRELKEWIKSVRDKAAELDRKEVCDITLGGVFAFSPNEEDGSWPCIPIREIIEDAESSELERGFAIGIANKRGIFSKAIGEGGQQERALAEKYDAYAKSCLSSHPRTASILLKVAKDYKIEAKSEDERAKVDK
ncbi:MAG: hypothetical protein EHM45_02170 [Desulfobacteraceae bacterium]|nr:MAG: hypothetical protein EHM45_02170 [Desulfobacteraceae bacterium]